LLLLAIAFSLKPKTDIRVIPLTLFVLVAMATWGPWSAMSVSRWDQTRRLQEFLVNNGLMKDGHVMKATTKVDFKVSNEISNITAYLQQSFGLRTLEKWAPAGESVSWDKLTASEFVTKYLGLEYSGSYYGGPLARGYLPNGQYFNFSTRQEAVRKLHGYEYYATYYLYGLQNKAVASTMKLTTDKGEVVLNYSSLSGELRIDYQGRSFLVAKLDQAWIEDKKRQYGTNKYDMPEDILSFVVDEDGFHARVYITTLAGQIEEEEGTAPLLTNISGNILFTLD